MLLHNDRGDRCPETNIPCSPTDRSHGIRFFPRFCVNICPLAVVKLCALTAFTSVERIQQSHGTHSPSGQVQNVPLLA